GKEGVIAYASKTIVGAQERYSVTELELLAVKWAVGQFHISSKQLALRKIHEFMLKNNQLYWRKEGIERKVVQQHEMEEILFNLHGIRSCDTCQQLRNRKKIEQLHPIEVGKVFDCVGIDIVGPLPITSTTEYLTKWPEARAIKDIQANTVAQFIYEDIICRHGTPKVLLSDRGTSFVNSVVRALCETMKTAHILTERFNKTLCETLAKYVIQNGNFEWDQFVLAEKPGPRRQILCEFLIEEINQTLGVPEAIEPSFTSTTTPITDQQTGLEENETITRTIITTASENPEKGSSSSVAGQTTLIVNCVHIDQNYSAIEEFQPITFLKYKNQSLLCRCDKKIGQGTFQLDNCNK
ncbi:8034_t:CDS:2, partial [Entrophospora sp. SA101]